MPRPTDHKDSGLAGDRGGSNLLISMIDWMGGTLNGHVPGFESDMTKFCNRYTATMLVINKAQFNSTKKAFSASNRRTQVKM